MNISQFQTLSGRRWCLKHGTVELRNLPSTWPADLLLLFVVVTCIVRSSCPGLEPPVSDMGVLARRLTPICNEVFWGSISHRWWWWEAHEWPLSWLYGAPCSSSSPSRPDTPAAAAPAATGHHHPQVPLEECHSNATLTSVLVHVHYLQWETSWSM